MRAGLRALVWPLVIIIVAFAAYALLRHKRTELVDFEVYRTAATRALSAEPLYRREDGHYQYKYLPAFAIVLAPVAWPSKEIAEAVWFAVSVGLLVLFTRLCLDRLPDRRLSATRLVWLTLLLTGKFWVKELAFGQTNLVLGILVVAALMCAQHDRRFTTGTFVGLAVFVKPYALVLVPWLAWAQGLSALVTFAGVLLAGLVFPAAVYGWSGNLHLVADWYRTVTDTTMPNLLLPENISIATMWAKWIDPGAMASALAAMTAAVFLALAAAMAWKRRRVLEPNYLECGFLVLLVPLLSPQGWDYVLLLALPAYMCLIDRWGRMTGPWRAATALGMVLTSLTVFDVVGRSVYTYLMQLSVVSVGALVLAVCLAQLRWRALA